MTTPIGDTGSGIELPSTPEKEGSVFPAVESAPLDAPAITSFGALASQGAENIPLERIESPPLPEFINKETLRVWFDETWKLFDEHDVPTLRKEELQPDREAPTPVSLTREAINSSDDVVRRLTKLPKNSTEYQQCKKGVIHLDAKLKSILGPAVTSKQRKEMIYKMLLQTSVHLFSHDIYDSLEHRISKFVPHIDPKAAIATLRRHSEWSIDREPPVEGSRTFHDEENDIKITVGKRGGKWLATVTSNAGERVHTADSFEEVRHLAHQSRLHLLLHELFKISEGVHDEDVRIFLLQMTMLGKAGTDFFANSSLTASKIATSSQLSTGIDAVGGALGLISGGIGVFEAHNLLHEASEKMEARHVLLKEAEELRKKNKPEEAGVKESEAELLLEIAGRQERQAYNQILSATNSLASGGFITAGRILQVCNLVQNSLSLGLLVTGVGAGAAFTLEGVRTSFVEGRNIYKTLNKKDQLQGLKNVADKWLEDHPDQKDKADLMRRFASFQGKVLNIKLFGSTLGAASGVLTASGGALTIAAAAGAAGVAAAGPVGAGLIGAAAAVAVGKITHDAIAKQVYVKGQKKLEESSFEASDKGILVELYRQVKAEKSLANDADKILTNAVVKGYLHISNADFFLNMLAPLAEEHERGKPII